MARLQGFDDDFVFYNSQESQQDDVLRALPPIVAKNVALTILRIIQSFRIIEMDDSHAHPSPKKRPRLEEGEGESRSPGRDLPSRGRAN
jgi:hypothetical protein